MTTPAPVTISYGHAWLDDCTEDSAADWEKSFESGMTLTDIVVVDDDVFDMAGTYSGTPGTGGWINASALGINTTAFPKFRFRYKISGSVRLSLVAVFDVGTQPLLTLGSSTTMKTLAVTLTGAKTLNYIEIQLSTGTGHVYLEFMIVYKGDFSFPNTGRGISLMGQGRYARPAPPGASGAETENLGSELAEVIAECDLDLGTWTRAGDVVPGQVFFDIVHNSKTEDFQWLDTGELAAQFKCTLEKHDLHNEVQGNNDTRHLVHLTIYEYRRGPANNETEVERWGLDL